VESPKLLEISGVGQGALLQSLGVKVVHESRGVGENLQDHYMIGCQAPLKEREHSINYLSQGRYLLREIARYGFSRKGLLSYAVAHGTAFAKTRQDLEVPDVQIHVMAASMDLAYLAEQQGLRLDSEPGLASNPCQLRPESRGSIHAKSPDGMVAPSIVPNYLSDPADRAWSTSSSSSARSGSSPRSSHTSRRPAIRSAKPTRRCSPTPSSPAARSTIQ
jgi:choline dehydrogenase